MHGPAAERTAVTIPTILVVTAAWAAAGLALQWGGASGGAYLAFYVISVVAAGVLMQRASAWLEVLREGPHPLSPAAEDWEPPDEEELAEARARRDGRQLLAACLLAAGVVVFLLGQADLLLQGGSALVDDAYSEGAYRIRPASPFWGPFFALLTVACVLTLPILDALATRWSGTPREPTGTAARRWTFRGTLLAAFLAVGFWAGWFSDYETGLWIVTVGIFGGLFLLIVRLTW